MPKFDKGKLLVLKDNIDRYLKKLDEKEKGDVKALLNAFANTRLTIDKVLEEVKDDKSYQRFALLLKDLKNEVGQAIQASTPDMKPLAQALTNMASAIGSKKDFSDEGMVKALVRIEKLLKEQDKIKLPKDNSGKIIKAIKGLKLKTPKVEFPDSISVDNFPPQKIPQPVTNININPLRGFIKTTAATVKTTLTVLPTYGVLDDRRSIMIFNNSSSTTVYIGGSDVTSTNGLPVLAQTYSPSIDAGVRMILYGVVSSGTANVRVIEISNEATGG